MAHRQTGPSGAPGARVNAAEHRDIVPAISKRKGSPCSHCFEESVGTLIFAGKGNLFLLCEYHARDYKSLDFIPSMGFVTYGSIPAIIPARRGANRRYRQVLESKLIGEHGFTDEQAERSVKLSHLWLYEQQ
jgi:hypothetical protein